jgi:predicted transcriptional regulator
LNSAHTRDKILRYIRENPGTYRSKISQEFGLSWGSIVYHVRILQAQGLVHETGARGRLILWANGAGERRAQLAAVLNRRWRTEVLQVVRGNAPLGIQDLSEQLGLSRKIVRRVLEDLMSQGFLTRQPGRRGKFQLSDIGTLPADLLEASAWSEDPMSLLELEGSSSRNNSTYR